ncbi:MAG: hypothetical protein AB7E66_12000 [Parvibaculaceae bacterium]
MTPVHFESYRWQDHVIRPGRWKADLPTLLVPLGLMLAAGFCR